MKKQVTFDILEDMKKYIKDFDPDEYQKSLTITDESVILYLREYYAENLPIDVTAWFKVNEPDDRIKAEFLEKQVWFVRDVLCTDILFSECKYGTYMPPMVVATYCSESVMLPVYQIDIADHGLKLVIRGDFNDWLVAIKSTDRLDHNFCKVLNTLGEAVPPQYEYFPKEDVYGTTEYVVKLDGAYGMISFFKFLKEYLQIGK